MAEIDPEYLITPELVRLAEHLPELVWISAATQDGLGVSFYATANSPIDWDRATAQTGMFLAAFMSYCTRFQTGEFRYALIGGDHTIYMFLFNEILLVFALDRYVPLERILALFRGPAEPLYKLLKRINSQGHLTPDSDNP